MLGRLFGRRGRAQFVTACEYWVYLPEEVLPAQDLVMERMMKASPYGTPGKPPVGPKEALLWSDIRLHVGLALRQKNPHAFRPDLFEAHVEPTPELLAHLSGAKSLAKVRYISEEHLSDRRHLRFLPYVVEAVVHLSGAKAVFDASAERLFEAGEIAEGLSRDPTAERPEMHLRTIWLNDEFGGRAATRGLIKIGMPELETPVTEADHRVVVCDAISEAARVLWEKSELLEEIEIELFGDCFCVKIMPGKRSPLTARVLRLRQK